MSTPTEGAGTEGESTEADALPWNRRATPAGQRPPRSRDFPDPPARRPDTGERGEEEGNRRADREQRGPLLPRPEPPAAEHDEEEQPRSKQHR
jgi:hypothetical protein